MSVLEKVWHIGERVCQEEAANKMLCALLQPLHICVLVLRLRLIEIHTFMRNLGEGMWLEECGIHLKAWYDKEGSKKKIPCVKSNRTDQIWKKKPIVAVTRETELPRS